MVNSNDSSLQADITQNDNKLEEINNFCYLRATLLKDDSSETYIRIRLASCDVSDDTTKCYMEQTTRQY